MTDRSMHPFVLRDPANNATAAVFSSPHSGREYPSEFIAESGLTALELRSSEDAFVDQLFGDVPEYGAPLLAATAPRAFVDLNRSPEDLDPAVVRGAPDGTRNPRVLAGFGVIPRLVGNMLTIDVEKVDLKDAQARLYRFHHPYHAMLEKLLRRARDSFGFALLIDCHSMPSSVEAKEYNAVPGRRVILGNRFGKSCSPDFAGGVEAIFRRCGFHVSRNDPFPGGYITERYGRPEIGFHAIQVEIDRSLYMNEAKVTKLPVFDVIRRELREVAAEICRLAGGVNALAAE